MIINAEIIELPTSGEYKEVIYDIESPWNSPLWTSIKFTNDDDLEWVGVFRGEFVNIALSHKHQTVLVLTNNYLFQLDIHSGKLMIYDDHRNYYQGLTVSPLQDFIICDYSSIYKIKGNIDERIELEFPISISLVDYVKLKKWEGNVLKFTCEEPTSVHRFLCEMEYDCITDTIVLSEKKIL